MEKEEPKWFEPYSKVRKFCWYWCLIVAFICAPGAFIGNTQKIRVEYAGYTAFNLFCCWLSFGSTFKVKKEEENE